jgi:hypothetical protein
MAQKEPEKWMPSTHANASRRCAKLLLLLIHLRPAVVQQARVGWSVGWQACVCACVFRVQAAPIACGQPHHAPGRHEQALT